MIIDPTRLVAVQTAALGMSSSKNRKDSRWVIVWLTTISRMLILPFWFSHRRAVIGSLLSHVCAWRCHKERCAILHSLSGINDVSIFRGVLPLLSPPCRSDSEESKWLSSLSEHEQAYYLDLLFRTVTAQSARTLLADHESTSWKTLLDIIGTPPQSSKCTSSSAPRRCLKSDRVSGIGSQLRSLALRQLAKGVFGVLNPSQKVAWIRTIVRTLQTLSTVR